MGPFFFDFSLADRENLRVKWGCAFRAFPLLPQTRCRRMPKLANVCLSERSYPIPCDPGELDLKPNDFCVISAPGGAEETGYVKGFEYRCDVQVKDREIPRILRRAVPREVRAWHYLKRREAEAVVICKEKAAKHNLEMKVSSVRFDDQQRKISFNFTADKRVDFRELVKDLAATFRARIELWQIGVRDETRNMSGIGVCGRHLCCSSWLRVFAPVSIRFAKTQDIQFSPTKLSGNCGRLRCCLAYEQKQYVEMGKDAPPVGAMVGTTEYGECKMVDRNLIRRTATISDAQGQLHVIPFSRISEVKVTSEAEQERGQFVLDPEETPEEASAILEDEPLPAVAGRPIVDFADPPTSEPATVAFSEAGSARPSLNRPAPSSAAEARQRDQTPLTDKGKEEDRRRPRRRGRRGGKGRHKDARGADGKPAGGDQEKTPPAPSGDQRPEQDNAYRHDRRHRRGDRDRQQRENPGG